MKKSLIVLLLALFLFSCNKRVSELEITEDITITEEVKEKTVYETTKAETKPLIIITRNDSLQIMVRSDGAPGMFLNESGEVEGFYVELEKAIMKEMEQKYELIAYTDLGPLLQNLKSGAVHSALATPLISDFKTFLNISNPYEVLEFVIFLQSDSKLIVPDKKEEAIRTLYGKKIGVQTRGHVYQVLRGYKDIKIIEYPTTTVAMEALNKGEVDAVPEVKRIGQLYSKQNNWNVKPVGAPIFGLDVGTGFSQALDSSVIDRYNVALKTLLDSGYVDNLFNNYFSE